ncbi:MAG: Lrp/AsnC family transcriptional regulator [Promethearchaeota archaeon]
MVLDNIDKQIIKVLFNNGRENLQTLADQVMKKNDESMSHTGIRKRITKMEESKLLKIQGNLSIKNLNYTAAILLMELENFEKIKIITKEYMNCPRVFLLAQLSGRYNLILGIVGQNLDVLQNYLNHCGPSNKKGVLHTEVLFLSSFNMPKFFPLNLFSNVSQESKCGNICKECEAFLDSKCLGCGHF